jgi:flagellar protein FlaI
VRKVTGIYEVIGFDIKRNMMKYNQVFEWDPTTDKILIKNKSHALWKIMMKTGMKENDIVEELKRRMTILSWLKEQNINDYRDVGRVMSLYYDFPEMILDAISGGI